MCRNHVAVLAIAAALSLTGCNSLPQSTADGLVESAHLKSGWPPVSRYRISTHNYPAKWEITAYEIPRQIAANICTSRKVRLSVNEQADTIAYREITPQIALRPCAGISPEDFVVSFDAKNDAELVAIVDVLTTFVRT